nr:hypothetical transcript [Hymenolepis microstoma]
MRSRVQRPLGQSAINIHGMVNAAQNGSNPLHHLHTIQIKKYTENEMNMLNELNRPVFCGLVLKNKSRLRKYIW